MKQKILVILGPTAMGKSDLAVKLAKKFNGEVISADSRQVYTGLNIGTGKITKRETRGIPHHLLDVVSPKNKFTVTEWKKQAEKAIPEIIGRGGLPIIVGGTGFYIQSIVDDIVLPEVPPNSKLRKKLEKKTTQELFRTLQKLDPRRAKTIDSKNPRRLIRAIEITEALGKVPKIKKGKSKYNFIQIGIKPGEKYKEDIHKRNLKMIKDGMVSEARRLHKNGLSWKRMDELGLEYRLLAKFLKKEITKEELIEKLDNEIWNYAKRQITWFKKDKRIMWFKPKDLKKIEKVTKNS